MAKDYIPETDEGFLDWTKNLYTFAVANFSRWNVPDPQTRIQPLLNDYDSAFTAAKNPNRGKVDIVRKKETRDALKKEVRIYVKAYLASNPLVTDEDKAAMDIPIHKTTHTPVHVPTTAPQLFIDTGTRRRLIITYRDEGSNKRGKPQGVHGIEVRWAIQDAPPADLKELSYSAFDTHPPLTLEFEEHERGKHVYLSGRWEINREGEKGPFGDIEDAIIP